MGRNHRNQSEIACTLNYRAEAVRKIADRLTEDAYRNLLRTVAEEFEGKAKGVAYRASRAAKRASGKQKPQTAKEAPNDRQCI